MTEPLWRDLTHEQVWDQVHAGPGPYVSDSAATAWRNAEAALSQIDGDLDAAITKAAGWTGTAADATRGGLTPLGSWAVDATGSAGRAAASLTEHQVQVGWVRANLPEPGPAPVTDPPIAVSDPAVLQGWTGTVARNTALADQAFHVMDTYATNTALIQQQVPTWTPPPAVTVSVAEAPPPSGSATTSPQRAAGTFPATVAPAAASPSAAAGAAGAAAVGVGVTQRPADRAAVQDGGGAGRLPPAAVSTITPTASGPAEPSSGGRASASRDTSPFPVPGGLAGRILSGGPGVLRGGPDRSERSTRGGPGGFDGSGARAGPSGTGTAGNLDGVLRGLPDGVGVLRGGSSGTSAPPSDQGSPAVGPPRVGRGDHGGRTVGGPANDGYLPPAGVGLASQDNTHRRPNYRVDTDTFFADDRRLAGPVITPEESMPLRT